MGAGWARAQLVPERVYYGKDRAIPMTAALPADAPEGEVSVRLLAPVTAEPVASAAIVPGRVDLGGLFPTLWKDEPRLLYAQLMAGSTPVGPAVVLQPMVTPRYALGVSTQTRAVIFQEDQTGRVYTGLRAYVDRHVELDTTQGPILLAMRPDEAPNTVWNFLTLVEGGFYTDIAVHRVVARLPGSGAPFVIQFGDPTGEGTGGPGYYVDAEPSALPHDFGVVSMARTSDPNSNGSQVFLCLSREGTQNLDGKYTAFAQAVGGAEAIAAISAAPIADPTTGRPENPPVIRSARLLPAPPYGTGPAPVKPVPANTAR